MSEEAQHDQNVNSAPDNKAEVEAKPTAAALDKTGGKTYTEDQLEQIIKDRLERASKKAEQQAAQARAQAEADAAKKNGEWQKLAEQREKELADMQAAIAERDAALKARELADLKRSIAERVGLPTVLAARLMGENDKELEADAKALLETLPKPAPEQARPKPQPGLAPANPGANGSQGETLAQRRQKLHGVPTADAFDPAANRQKGGGVYINIDPGAKE